MVITGYMRKDKFGRIIIDECPSDEHHLKYSTAKEGQERAMCRYLLEDIVLDEIRNFGKCVFEIIMDPDNIKCQAKTTTYGIVSNVI